MRGGYNVWQKNHKDFQYIIICIACNAYIIHFYQSEPWQLFCKRRTRFILFFKGKFILNPQKRGCKILLNSFFFDIESLQAPIFWSLLYFYFNSSNSVFRINPVIQIKINITEGIIMDCAVIM